MPILCCTIVFLVRTYCCRPGDGFIGFSTPTHLMQKSVFGRLTNDSLLVWSSSSEPGASRKVRATYAVYTSIVRVVYLCTLPLGYPPKYVFLLLLLIYSRTPDI